MKFEFAAMNKWKRQICSGFYTAQKWVDIDISIRSQARVNSNSAVRRCNEARMRSLPPTQWCAEAKRIAFDSTTTTQSLSLCNFRVSTITGHNSSISLTFTLRQLRVKASDLFRAIFSFFHFVVVVVITCTHYTQSERFCRNWKLPLCVQCGRTPILLCWYSTFAIYIFLFLRAALNTAERNHFFRRFFFFCFSLLHCRARGLTVKCHLVRIRKIVRDKKMSAHTEEKLTFGKWIKWIVVKSWSRQKRKKPKICRVNESSDPKHREVDDGERKQKKMKKWIKMMTA